MSDPSQPVMAPLTTFHPFSRLPWELRNEIWKQSIRPLDRPGAHVFSVEERDLEDLEPYKCDVVCSPIKMQHYQLEPTTTYLSIAVPAKTMSSGPTGNPSAYMFDGGLWTACKESRAVMERTFNHQKWDPIRKVYPSDDSSPPSPQPVLSPREKIPTPPDPYHGEASLDLVPATGFFWSSPPSSSSDEQDKTGQHDDVIAAFPHYFTVFPHQDLMVFRPPRWDPYVSSSYWYWLMQGFPFGSEKWGFQGFCGYTGFAFEYDPNWGQEPEFRATRICHGTMPDGAVGVFDNIEGVVRDFSQHGYVATIWLIDYRLRLKNEISEALRDVERHQRLWYGGDGCRFVEVYPSFSLDGGDCLHWYRTEGIDGEDSARGPGLCHSFIEAFERTMFFPDRTMPWDTPRSDTDYWRWDLTIGLLACLR